MTIYWYSEWAMGQGAETLVPMVVAISFAAGLNVYATVGLLGLLARLGAIRLPPELHLLSSDAVIAASAILFLIEFFADKIPVFDLIWNALHTFIRVPVAALVAYGAAAHLSPAMQGACAALGALVALAAHGGKTAVRAAVSASPEPLSNAALSATEDMLAIGIVWFAAHHPYAAGLIVAGLLAMILMLARFVFRSIAALFRWPRIQKLGSSAEGP